MEGFQSLQDLGYGFNTGKINLHLKIVNFEATGRSEQQTSSEKKPKKLKDGQLRKLNEDGLVGEEPFQFNISDNHDECQAHYEDIGDAVTQHVYSLLETQVNLTRLPVPVDSTAETGTFIFASKEYDQKDTLLVLIHGSGVVRAGQWARSLIINESLDMGTQIPYIQTAIAKGYGVLVTNTNDNFTDEEEIPGSGTPEQHGLYVWENYIAKAKASSILIVAHSFGGVVAVHLANRVKEFKDRAKAIALTDSVHGFSNRKVSEFLKKVTRNWVSSSEPLDTPINTPDYDITRVSAGHPKHEMTSYSCMESVFKFFDEKLSK